MSKDDVERLRIWSSVGRFMVFCFLVTIGIGLVEAHSGFSLTNSIANIVGILAILIGGKVQFGDYDE